MIAGRRGGALFFERLRAAIAEVEDQYDVVVLESPPSLGFLTLGAIYASTGMIVTVHPAMLDVASMSQFLLMMSDLIRVIEDAGAVLRQDFFHYLVTRHNRTTSRRRRSSRCCAISSGPKC